MGSSIPGPKEVRKFMALSNDSETEAFLPFYTVNMQGAPMEVVGFMWFRGEKTYGFMYNPSEDEWERIGVLQRAEPAFMEIDTVFDTSVTVIGEDIESQRGLYYQLKEKTRDYYDIQIPYEFFETDEDEEEGKLSAFPDCTHPETHPSSVEGEPFTADVCSTCERVCGITHNGQTYSRETLLDFERLNELEPKATVWSDDSGLSAIISPEESDVDWIDAALYILGEDAAYQAPTITGYESQIFEGAVVAYDEDVVGYASWNWTFEIESTVVLRQMYVRPEYRNDGLAKRITTFWWNHQEETHFFAGDPNPAGRAVIEKTGYYDELADDGEPVAKETYVMPTIGLPSPQPRVS